MLHGISQTKKDKREPRDPTLYEEHEKGSLVEVESRMVVARHQQKLVQGGGMRRSFSMGTNSQLRMRLCGVLLHGWPYCLVTALLHIE